MAPAAQPSICDQMRRDIDANLQRSSPTSPMDPVVDIPVVESLSPLILSSSMPPPPVVDAPVWSLTPNNRSLSFLQSGPVNHPQLHVPQSKGGGAVSSVSLGSTDLLYYVEQLPLDQTPHVNITCIDTMLYICYSFIVIGIFYSMYAQVPWNFLYACYVK